MFCALFHLADGMISNDLDTEASSTISDQKLSFFQSMFRSLKQEGSRSRNNRHSEINFYPSWISRPHSDTYSECLSSLSCFIHDGSISLDEADDPCNAICYFHPPNYTPTEQWEFTGPIVGAVRFMSSFANSPPKSIHLSNSSIAVLCVDQFTIALKASKILCVRSLEACLSDLYKVFSLFFNDLKNVKKLCSNSDPEITLGRFKFNLAHIWTKLIGLVSPFKLLHPISHVPHFIASKDIENQLYQFFACVIAIFSGFSGNTFGCLLSYQSRLVHSTFDTNLTRTLMLGTSLSRALPQTAYVFPPNTRLPKSMFIRYAYAPRSQLLESKTIFSKKMATLPSSALFFLNRWSSSMIESAFSPAVVDNTTGGSSYNSNEKEFEKSNAAMLSRYFDFAWELAGQRGFAQLEDSFLSDNFNSNPHHFQPKVDHWESRSSSMSSVALNMNGLYSRQASLIPDGDSASSSLVGGGSDREESDTHKELSKSANVSGEVATDSVESDGASGRTPTPTAVSCPENNASSVREADSRLSGPDNGNYNLAHEAVNNNVNNVHGFLDSGNSSLQNAESAYNVTNSSEHEKDYGQETDISLQENEVSEDVVKTVLYSQNHGPLSLVALLPASKTKIKVSDLRRLYDAFLPLLADVCTVLMHLESESQRSGENESVLVSFEPSKQRLHRLSLCSSVAKDARFDGQLFAIQNLLAKDQNIRDLQISDWSSHVRVTKETDDALSSKENGKGSALTSAMPYQGTSQGRQSYIKVKRNGCASSLAMLPSVN